MAGIKIEQIVKGDGRARSDFELEKIQQEQGLQEAAEKLIRNCDGRKCHECYFFHRNCCVFGNSPLNWEVICSQENEKQAVAADNVNHPKHYELPGGGETIDFIDSVCGDGVDEYYRGNILKYICRYKDKGGAESLKKARWYLDKLIAFQETKEELEAED